MPLYSSPLSSSHKVLLQHKGCGDRKEWFLFEEFPEPVPKVLMWTPGRIWFSSPARVSGWLPEVSGFQFHRHWPYTQAFRRIPEHGSWLPDYRFRPVALPGQSGSGLWSRSDPRNEEKIWDSFHEGPGINGQFFQY